jgi:hypothetical protein
MIAPELIPEQGTPPLSPISPDVEAALAELPEEELAALMNDPEWAAYFGKTAEYLYNSPYFTPMQAAQLLKTASPYQQEALLSDERFIARLTGQY